MGSCETGKPFFRACAEYGTDPFYLRWKDKEVSKLVTFFFRLMDHAKLASLMRFCV